jgi:hypothetical protein
MSYIPLLAQLPHEKRWLCDREKSVVQVIAVLRPTDDKGEESCQLSSHIQVEFERGGGNAMLPWWLWELLKALSQLYDYVCLGVGLTP